MTRKILATALLLTTLALTSCAPTVEPANISEAPQPTPSSSSSQIKQAETCKQLALGQKVIEDTEKDMRKTYAEEYFETEDWLVFVDGYWKGFWDQHKYCLICQENGDVPKED